jgi:hypothetical protein
MVLQVTAAATAGTTKWDDGSITKTQLLQQSWMAGTGGTLVNQLATMVTDTASRALQTDLMSLVNNLGLGSFANVGASLTPITNRMANLNAGGQFAGSGIIGSIAASLVSGVLAIGTIPTSQLNMGNITDIQTLSDHITNAMIGSGSQFVTSTLPQARGSMDRMFTQVSDNVTMVQALQTQNQQSQQASGITVNFDFSGYPDGNNLPSAWTVTYSGAGTSLIGIKSGTAGWSTLNNDGNRTAIIRYNIQPMATDWQVVSGSMAQAPQGASGSSAAPRLYALGRMNATGDTYVWARGYCTGFLSYAGDMGCMVAGAETVWRSNVNFGWNLSIQMRLGVNNNLREYQVFAGTTQIIDYTEVGTVSQIGPNYRYFGCKSEMTSGSGGARDPGGINSTSSFDNAPPSSLGSTFRAMRLSTTTASLPNTGYGYLPAGFMDNTDRITGDMAWDGTTLTIQTEGTYLFHARYAISNLSTNNKLDVVFNKMNPSAASIRETGEAMADSYGGQSSRAVDGMALIYVKPGDQFRLAYYLNGGSCTLLGSADGIQSYFEVGLLNRSLA